ncbi:MAG: hypothetical protein DRN11_04580 [Thermoplasmata archaeon]|nr:MAG: hypothetical protein DRN11_04580 [Thermoplasmata archaeon]
MELKEIKGIGKTYEKKLFEAGIRNAEDLIIADLKELAKKTGISEKKIEKWREEAKKKVEYKKAEIIEDLTKIAFIAIKENNAKVKIKEIWHENVPVFKGNFDELKEEIEKEEIAVFVNKKIKLWFNGKWYENIPYEIKKEKLKEKKSFIEKLREWWKR